MVDIAFHKTRQGWKFKALTDKARAAMGVDMGAPQWLALAGEVFWSGVPEERFDASIKKLRDLGLEVPDRDIGAGVNPAPVAVNPSDYLA